MAMIDSRRVSDLSKWGFEKSGVYDFMGMALDDISRLHPLISFNPSRMV